MNESTKPLVNIILGRYNCRRSVKTTLESVRNNGMAFPYEIIVVDGGSTDATLDWLIREKEVITIVQHNGWISFRGKPIDVF